MKAAASIATGSSWREALDSSLDQVLADLSGAPVDLSLLFASPQYAPNYSEILKVARERLAPEMLIGCSGQAVIGNDREEEDEPAISIIAFSLPGVELDAVHISQSEIQSDDGTATWLEKVESSNKNVNAWIVLADPFSIDPERLLAILSQTFPDAPLIGGLASGDPRSQQTHVFLNGSVYEEGAVALALGGAYTVQTIVAQGAEPIGEPWTITAASGNIIQTLGMRPALQTLIDTLRSLPQEMQQRAQRNVLVGIAMNEYKDELHRGDYLVRTLLGANQEEGWIAIGAQPTPGQTLQFHVRDPLAADADLLHMLKIATEEQSLGPPVGALLCACNGRGVGLFGTPSHDARMINEVFGGVPLAGFFCNGEIGPVGGKPFVHGYTASIAVIRPKSE